MTASLRCGTSSYHFVPLWIYTLYPLAFSWTLWMPHANKACPNNSFVWCACLFCLCKGSVVLSPTKHEFSNEAMEELKRAAGKYAAKREALQSCGLVHLQDQMFRRPAMRSSHDLSSVLLPGVCNCDWKVAPCWFCSHNFICLKISTSWNDLTVAPSGEYVSFVFNWLSGTEMPPGALFLTLEFSAGF